MGITGDPQIMFGKVMHARLFPKRNKFSYGIYYLVLPLSKLDKMPVAYNRFAPLSFYDRDHGACDGSDLQGWARDILDSHGMDKADGEITLICMPLCMPRIFGYVFNPVSFWLCHDKQGGLRAVICEVHNTFGEYHSYLCAYPDQRVISHEQMLEGDKLFHVSPFLEREGHYSFRFDVRGGKFGALIDFYNAEGEKQLVTTLLGDLKKMNKQSLKRAFWRYPLVTMKSIALIHWQAVKLLFKGIKYISKPLQKQEKNSATRNITKV